MQNFIKPLLLLFATTLLSYTNMQAQDPYTKINTTGNFEGTALDGYNVANYTRINPVNGTSTPGKFAITTNPNLMNTTYISGGDHTTGTGKMMVVDGSTSGFQFFWTTGSCGCPSINFTAGKTYTFSFWVKSVSNDVTSLSQSIIQPLIPVGVGAADQNPPNIIVPLPSLGWQQVGFTFTATAGSVMIRLATQSTSSIGNDFAVDDFSLIEGTLPLDFRNDTPAPTNPTCPDSSDGSISAAAKFGKPPYSYTITGPKTITNTTGVFNGLPIGTYNISVTDSNSPTSTITQPTPITLSGPTNDLDISPGTSTPVCPGKSTTLTATGGKGGYTWTANPTDSSLTTPNSASITVSPTKTTTYTVTSGLTSNLTNFITNGDFSFGNTDFSSDYTYSLDPTKTGQQKNYGIVTNPKSWFPPFAACTDHTTGTGRMFVTDAATDGTSKVWSQNVPGLKPNQDYDFTYFLQSLSGGTVAKMEVFINGVSLGALRNAPSSTCAWAKQKYTWNSGSVTSATITIYDREKSGPENDFAIDDITFTESVYCQFTKTVTITVDSSVNLIINPPAAVCAPLTVDITDVPVTAGSTPGILSYWEDDKATNPLANPDTIGIGGTYFIKNTVGSCFVIEPVTVTITNNGLIAAPEVTTPVNYCQNDTPAALTAIKLSGATLNWYGTDPIGGTSSSAAPTPSTASINTTSYYVSQTTGTCGESPRAKIDVVVSAIPTITSTKPNYSCGAGIVNLEAVASSTTAVINWYTNATGGSSLATGTTFNPNITTDTPFYVDATENGCTTATRTEVKASIKPIPVLAITCGTPAVNSVTFNWNLIADATSYNYSYSIASGTPILGSVTGATSTLTVSGLSAGQNVVITITPVGSTCAKANTADCSALNCSVPTFSIKSLPVCFGTDADVTIENIVPVGTYTYDWTQPTGAPKPGNVDNFKTAFAGNYSVIITDTTTKCPSAIVPVTVTINPLPTVTVNSPSICLGTTTSATVTAKAGTVGTYSYDWTVPIGASNPGDEKSFEATITGNYSVIMTNTTTKCSIESAIATVTINTLPIVKVNDPAIKVCSGESAELIASPVTTGNYTYSWTVPIGATNPGDVTKFKTTVAGNYSISIKDKDTSCQSSSEPVTVAINPLPTVTISAPPVCSGEKTMVTAKPIPLTGNYDYQWTVPVGEINPGNIPNFETTVVGDYSVIITDKTTTCSSLKITATVAANALPDVLNPPSPQTICSGQIAGVALLSSVSGTTFSWIATSSTGVTGASDGNGNAISDVLTNSGTTSGTVDYTVTPTSNGCVGTPVKISFIVSPTPVATSTVGSYSICSESATDIKLSSNVATTTYNWNVIQSNSTGAVSGSGDTINQTLTTIGNKSGEAAYAITPSANGCSGLTTIVRIIVNPIPTVTITPGKNPICSGTETNITLTSNVGTTTFDWIVSSQTGVAGALSGSGSDIVQTLTTTDLKEGFAEYTITPKVNGCIGTPKSVLIRVNPTPEVFGPSTSTICSGKSTNITLSPSFPGTEFNWIAAPTSGISGTSSDSGNFIDDILVSGTTGGSVSYTITPSYKGCIGKSITVLINVDPLPNPTIKDGKICIEEATGKTLKNYLLETNISNTNFDFTWYFNNVKINGATENSYEAAKTGVYSVIVFNKLTGCSSKETFATVSETFPAISFTTITTDAFTANATIVVTVDGDANEYLYKIDNGAWQNSNVFTGLTGGLHTISVTDTEGCTDLTKEVNIIDYPKFFTPNGDGYNDTWNVIGLRDQPNSTIMIYDRYGKLLKQISTQGNGWDGTFNNQILPSTDYWFTINFLENNIEKLFKAHFSLKR